MAELKKKYGLITAICMVVGIVVGSGVFFKAEAMLYITKGDLPIALISWLIGGFVMVISAYTFAVMGTKFEKINGVVDYSEALVGSKYAYYVGWFMASIYYPAMTSALAWLSARYTMALFGYGAADAETMVLAFVYLILTTDTPRRFFGSNSFYTTAAHRMSRHIFDGAVTAEDVINLYKENKEAAT